MNADLILNGPVRTGRRSEWRAPVLCVLAVFLVAGGTWPATARSSPANRDVGGQSEPGLQGETMPGEARMLAQPYTKGVRLISRTAVPDGVQATMAWSGHCSYIPGKTGVTVIDAKDPRAPQVVRVLNDKGAQGAGETAHAAGAILAASVYGQAGPGSRPGLDDPAKAWVSIYDVSDCAHPRLILEYKWPERIHTITVSPNGKRIYGTVIRAGDGGGGIQVLDISDRAAPRFLGKFPVTRRDGSSFEFAPHEVSVSPDEKRIYAGVVSSRGDDLNQGVTTPFPSKESFGPDAGGIYILDNSDIALGRRDPKMRLVGTALHAGWHSAIQANIRGVPYLVGASELGACPGSWPKLTEISDESHPRVVGQFRMQMNLPENCPPRTEAEAASKGVVGRPGTAASHWNDVDNSSETRLGLFPFTWAGLRIVDLRNPENPTEVGYFKPGDSCMTHARYVQATGHIWFACTESGFYIIELRKKL